MALPGKQTAESLENGGNWNGTGYASPEDYIASLLNPPTTSAPTATSQAPDWSGGAISQLDQDVLARVQEGLKGPSQATQILMRQGNEAVAQRAKMLQGQAGARIASSGAIGQGTAAQLGAAAERDILQTLARQQQENTLLGAKEQQDYLQQAQGLLSRADQRQQAYVSHLSALAQNNPVLAAKLTDYMMSGGQGSIGEFTPEEQAQLAEWISQNKEMQDLLNEYLRSEISSGFSEQQAGQTKARIDALGSMTELDMSDPQVVAYLGSLKNTDPRTLAVGKNLDKFAEDNAGEVVKIGGGIYRVIRMAGGLLLLEKPNGGFAQLDRKGKIWNP